jgi:CIC family chloride channel protein
MTGNYKGHRHIGIKTLPGYLRADSSTSCLILFEMTGNYAIILPLLLSVVASTLLAHRLIRESIYTLKLTRRGVSIQSLGEAAFLSNVTVGEVMTRRFPAILNTKSVPELVEKLNKTGHHGLPVING